MLIEHHDAYGNPEEKQHPLPENWEVLAFHANKLPKRFGVVKEGKLYRSGIVWPHQIKNLKKDYGIAHVISLIEGNWLDEFEYDPDVTIHKFPFHQRRELTFERVRNIVEVINELEGAAIVHCFKGATRTGMVCAGYQIINEQKGNLRSILENITYLDVNISAIREISHYSR